MHAYFRLIGDGRGQAVALQAMGRGTVFAILTATALFMGGCGGRSVESNPPGTHGGECRPDLTCDVGLECFRLVCVPDGDEWSTDAGPPPTCRAPNVMIHAGVVKSTTASPSGDR